MITCTSCSKPNQDHYRFCLGCGAELPRAGAPGQPGGAQRADLVPDIDDEQTQVGTGVAVAPVSQTMTFGAPAVAAEAAPPPALPPGMCPECEFVNPPTNRFCASCGFKLDSKKPAATPKAKVTVSSEGSGAILVALDPEGNELGRHELARGDSIVGRDSGGVFAGDSYLSPKHARFHAKDGRVTLRDNGSLNCVFRRLLAEQRAPLKPGQFFRIGQELLVFDTLRAREADKSGVERMGAAPDGVIGSISLVVGRTSRAPTMPIPADGLNLGRERGHALFADDGYVSGLHCSVTVDSGEVFVTDLGSSNGTFIQLLGETELKNGDVLLMGQQLFRVTI